MLLCNANTRLVKRLGLDFAISNAISLVPNSYRENIDRKLISNPLIQQMTFDDPLMCQTLDPIQGIA